MIFDNLRGIQKGRNIRERAESTLEKLLKVEQETHQEYVGKVDDSWNENHDNIYLPMYQSLSLPDYTEQDLQSLLLAKANNNYPDKEAQVLGMYTGVLLHVLTERTQKEKKEAAFTFDLSGNEFNYLFYFAKRAGEVTVKNVKGTDTCAFIASYGGKAERLVLEGNEGDWAASEAGSEKGTVGALFIKDNEGNEAAFCAGSHGGNVGALFIKDNKGNYAAHWAGSDKGKIGTLAFYKAGRNPGRNTNAKEIIKGRKALTLYQKLEKRLPCLRT